MHTPLYLQIWKMVKRSQKYLSQGYTSQTWLDHDFFYSYYVWVNPHSSNESRHYQSPVAKTCEGCVPGVIGTQFYRYRRMSYSHYPNTFTLTCTVSYDSFHASTGPINSECDNNLAVDLGTPLSPSLPPSLPHTLRDLAQGPCYVFELYCIHEAAVPIKTAAMQCRELANQLWPNTKAAIAPFSLIN